MAKYRVTTDRFYNIADSNKSYSDNSPGLIYNKFKFHEIIRFASYKKIANNSLYGKYAAISNNVYHTIKYKYNDSKYNYELVLIKLFNLHKNLDKVLDIAINKRIQYKGLIDFMFKMGFFYHNDGYLSLQKNWDEFISDSFYEFYLTRHKNYDDTRGASYYTFFDACIKVIFYNQYIINRDKDDFDIQQEVYRYSWLKEDELTTNDNISSYSNYYNSIDPLEILIKDQFEQIVEQLYLPQAVSPHSLTIQ